MVEFWDLKDELIEYKNIDLKDWKLKYFQDKFEN